MFFVAVLAKNRDNGPVSVLPPKASKRKICKYFVAENSCYFGEYCRFLHIKNEIHDKNSHSTPTNTGPKPPRFTTRPNIAKISRDHIGRKEQLDIRDSEISYFGRRFRDAKFAHEDGYYFTEFEYKITDPEWVCFIAMFLCK